MYLVGNPSKLARTVTMCQDCLVTSKELEPADDLGGAYHPGRALTVVQDPDWAVALVPARADNEVEIWYARIVYPYRQFLRFQLWATSSIYKLGFVVGLAVFVWLLVHS
jgi:hypothetical protein